MLYGYMLDHINTLKSSEHLLASCDLLLIDMLWSYFGEKEQSECLSEMDFLFLKKVFSDRWDAIIDTPMDYLVLQDGINALWINLAYEIYRAYANSGVIANYFVLLIPSLSQYHSLISSDSISELPLSQYLLMEGDFALISLTESEEYALANGGLFLNCSVEEPRYFSTLEIQRLRRKGLSADKYIQRILDTANYKPIYPLKFSTIQALKTLVRDGFYPDGLKYKYELSDFESTQTEVAYNSFLNFLKRLEQNDASEFYHLMEHPIRLYKKKNTFRSIWEGVTIRYECASSASEYFLKLVLDYYPKAIGFRTVILNHIESSDMRSAYAPLEYADLTPKDAMLRLSVLFVSLLTERFDCVPFTSKSISWRGYFNQVTHSGKQIFDQILPLLQDVSYSQAIHTYEDILEKIYIAKEEPRWGRYAGTEMWMTNVLSENILLNRDVNASLPEFFTNIVNELKVRKDDPYRLKVLYDFTDELLSGFFLDSNSYISLLHIQIMRIHLLKKEEHIELRDKLATRHTMTNVNLFETNITDSIKRYFYFRLSALIAPLATIKASVFFKPGLDVLKQIETIQADSVPNMCENIKSMVHKSTLLSSEKKELLISYFNTISGDEAHSAKKKSASISEKGYTMLLSSMF